MTEQAQRIAIAKACGWAWVPIKDTPSLLELTGPNGRTYCTVREGFPKSMTQCEGFNLPDYLHDLNAMVEAEEVLLKKGLEALDNFRTWERYCKFLVNRLGIDDAIHATAAQRAEAFLRTLNLWDDTK